MKNKYIAYGIKAIIAAIIAFIILNLVCVFYYNLPVHSESETGATDYVWQSSKFYSRGTEGFAWGKTDENGFNNLYTLEQGDIDVLMMGSSHMEAFNVAQDKNAAYVLNEKFRDANIDFNVYNIGISGHTLARCLNNAENAVDEFKPNKYVIIETSSVRPDAEHIKAALENNLKPIESNNNGIIGKLQKLPLLRRLYAQTKSAFGDENEKDNSADVDEAFEKLLSRVNKKMQDSGIRLIIVYNCAVEIDEKGEALPQEDIESIQKFEKACERNNVIFVNMHRAFCDYYNDTNKLPRGFSNSRVGKGHLNQYGHEILADELFKVICSQESSR